MKIYIAGPMTGLPGHNLAAFAAAKVELDTLGYAAFNPGHRGVIPGYTWREYMRDAIALLVTCDAVALLDDWHRSKGARLEWRIANELEMPCKPVCDWLEGTA